MDDSDIRPGVEIEGIHAPTPPGHRFVISSAPGPGDDDDVIVDMIGPNGTAPLTRRRKLLRDHFRVVKKP